MHPNPDVFIPFASKVGLLTNESFPPIVEALDTSAGAWERKESRDRHLPPVKFRRTLIKIVRIIHIFIFIYLFLSIRLIFFKSNKKITEHHNVSDW